MNDCPCVSRRVGAHEQRGALAFLQFLLLWWQFEILPFDVLDEKVLRFEALFLDAGRGDIDFIAELDANAAPWNVRLLSDRLIGLGG